MNEGPLCRSLEDFAKEGRHLLDGRPFCHYMQNDQTALEFMVSLNHHGFEVSVTDAENCLRRMHIAVDTGNYPDELLREKLEVSRLEVPHPAAT